jgi:hypothetical protein
MNARRMVSLIGAGSLVLMGSAAGAGVASAHRNNHARHIHAVATFMPVEGANFLTTIPGAKTLQYGTVKLAAKADIDGQPYNLELSAGLEYVDGSGPFHGDITFIAPGGDALTFDYKGAATLNADGSTTVNGALKAFSGTGQFANTTGTGKVVGTRVAGMPVGTPVTYVMDADIRDGARSMPRVTACVEDLGKTNTGFTADLMGLPSERIITSNPDGRSFGLIRLTGKAPFDGAPAEIIDVANVAYSKGSGPFNGFITMKDPFGSTLVMRFDGGTKADANGGATINGPLTVIAGTGRWADATGNGELTGTRSGVVGSPLKAVAKISLTVPVLGAPC